MKFSIEDISQESSENNSSLSESDNNRKDILNINKQNISITIKKNKDKSVIINPKTGFLLPKKENQFQHISLNVFSNEDELSSNKKIIHPPLSRLSEHENEKEIRRRNEYLHHNRGGDFNENRSEFISQNKSRSKSDSQSENESESQNESQSQSQRESQTESQKESQRESINSSSKSNSKIVRFIKNNLNLYDTIRKNFISERYENSKNEQTLRKRIVNCLICEEPLNDEEIKDNILDCFHMFCDVCYYEYIKEKVNKNQIHRITCPQKDCNIRLSDNFILKKLFNDIELFDKYKKLQMRMQLILDPKVQLCPFPDCESYARKKDNKNFVCCIQNKHKFCFNCLKDWHENKKCDDKVDKSFEKWRDSYKVKRCPKCKFFLEKISGCNHIKCFNCQYQFCWLCLNEYNSDHFFMGRCSGLQYTDCTLCSNRLINFLYQFLLIILKGVAFAIAFPFALVFFIYYKFNKECIDHYNDCGQIFYGISGALSCLSFIMCILPITSFICVLMLLYWPLQEKIFSFILDF